MPNTPKTWIEIKSLAIKNNINQFRKIIPKNCLLMAVVKSNAYGHGLIDFSKIANNFGVDWFGVDSVVEAEKLRKKGIKKPILVLGYTLKEKINDAINKNISLTIADFYALKNLKNLQQKNKKRLRIHLKIDTGMHRQGFLIKEIKDAAKILKKLNNFLIIEGVYTHFSSAANPLFLSETKKQIKNFNKAIEILNSFGFSNFLKHAAATSGTLIYPESHFDLVRIGIGLYGYFPSKETKEFFENKINLKPVLSWKTIVAQIKYLPKGSKIGYDLTEKLKRDSKVALLPIGYWHGYPRALSSIGKVLINGKEAKVLGRISMDMTSVDVTDIKNIKIGDEVVLIGKSRALFNSADDLAKFGNTINYEILTRINPLIKRVVI